MIRAWRARDFAASPIAFFILRSVPSSRTAKPLIFVFVPSMGNFVVPELLGGGKTVMVGNLIRDQFLETRDWPFGAVLALFVIALLVLLFALQVYISRRINGRTARA